MRFAMVRTQKKYRVVVRGQRPLLHNRFASEEANQKKQRKTQYDPKEEAEKKLYKDKNTGAIYIPAIHFEGALIEASKQLKWKGRKTLMDVFKSSVFVSPEQIPFLEPENPRDYKIDERPVRIKDARVLCWRPMWEAWSTGFDIDVYQPENLSGGELKEIVKYAGDFVGVGDFRPKFGTFDLVSFEEVS